MKSLNIRVFGIKFLTQRSQQCPRNPLKIWVLAAFAVSVVGCGSGDGDSGAPATREGKPDPGAAPLASNILFVEKEGQPVVVADLLPEAEKIEGYPADTQQEYLRIRAQEMAKSHKKAGGKPVKVRMILLRDKNECGMPDWAGAKELASFEIKEAEVGGIASETFSLDALVVKK